MHRRQGQVGGAHVVRADAGRRVARTARASRSTRRETRPCAAATSPSGVPGFRSLLEPLWAAGVVPDYRAPDALRLGLSPLSTSFAEVYDGVRLIADLTASL